MKKIYSIIAMTLIGYQMFAQNPSGSPVATHGLLKTKGNRIVGQADTAVSMGGNSMFWSQWAGGFYNANTVKWLKSDWNSKIIRAAMGVDETGGYITNSAIEKQKVFDVVDACIAEGLYVIIDWHSHHAENYKTESIAFFKEMATKYGQYPNVIYEIYNEPLDVTSWSKTIKPYAVDVISEIRKIDPDNLILVGTRTWSQEVVEAGNDPINDVNVAYVLHFYVGSHGKYLRDKAQEALDKGVPLFVSEWGVWGSDSDMENWMIFMKNNKLNWCNWAITTKVEPSSVLASSASVNGNWKDSDLSPIGKKVKNYMVNWPNWGTMPVEKCTLTTAAYTTMNLPGVVEAENFDAGCPDSSYHDVDASNQGGKYRTTSSVDIETCTAGGYNVGYIEKDEWLNYKVNVKSSGLYKVTVSLAAMTAGGKFKLQMDGVDVSNEIAVPATGGWQTWMNVDVNDINLTAKNAANLRLYFTNGGFNLNKLTFTSSVTGVEDDLIQQKLSVFPNPATDYITILGKKAGSKVLVVNMLGENLLESEEENINISSIPSGVYFIKTDGQILKLVVRD